MRRVVVTGVGAVTPIGNTAQESWEAAKKGTCGIGPITHYDTSASRVKLAAEVKNFHPEEYLDKTEIRKIDSFALFAIASAQQAFDDARLDMDEEDPDRCGIIYSSGIGGLTTIQREDQKGSKKGYDRISPHFIPMAISNMAAGHLGIRFGFHGICTSVVTACASGTNSIGEAFRKIKDGYQEVMLCGSSEASINELGIGGFTAMKALSFSEDRFRASIPFDAERDGFVMGEGGGAIILEEYEHAIKRGAKIYCEIAGYGTTCDAYHVTAPMPDGRMAAICMQNALREAGLDKVDYVNAHGTSTPLNDKGETAAMHLAFGEAAKNLMVSSSKSMIGHLLGASGAVEAVFTVLSVKDDIVPPTIGYLKPDPECDLDIVPNTARRAHVHSAMSNSLGFGGHNASIVFKKIKEQSEWN